MTVKKIQQDHSNELKRLLINLGKKCAYDIIKSKDRKKGYVINFLGNNFDTSVVFNYFSKDEIIKFITENICDSILDFSDYYEFDIETGNNGIKILIVKKYE